MTYITANYSSDGVSKVNYQSKDGTSIKTFDALDGMIPDGWANQATEFGIGDALLCGEFVERPVMSHIAARRCAEGGANLKVDWY